MLEPKHLDKSQILKTLMSDLHQVNLKGVNEHVKDGMRSQGSHAMFKLDLIDH